MIAGDPLQGVVTGRYLFGAPMPKRPTHWTFTRTPVSSAPEAIPNKYPDGALDVRRLVRQPAAVCAPTWHRTTARWRRTDSCRCRSPPTRRRACPYAYTLEGRRRGRVAAAHRQPHQRCRASGAVVHRRQAAAVLQSAERRRRGPSSSRSASTARRSPGIPIDVTLTQIQWHSVRRAEGNGFYSWETERKEVPSGEWHLTSAADPVPLDIPLPAGGYFILEARAARRPGALRPSRATSFYALGEGYTAWERYDHNRIDLVAREARPTSPATPRGS